MCNMLVLIDFECANQIIRYNMEWIFDGIGTTILSSLVSLLLGGGIGYGVCIKKSKVKQKQKAGDHASQIQIGRDGHVR